MAGKEAGAEAGTGSAAGTGPVDATVETRLQVGTTSLQDFLTQALNIWTHAHAVGKIEVTREMYLTGATVLLARVLALNLRDVPREQEAMQICFQLPLVVEIERKKMLDAQPAAGGAKSN